MIYEWDHAKAAANLKKHGASFEEAASVFLDPVALTFSDPDHSDEAEREITIGALHSGAFSSWRTASGTMRSGSSARGKRPAGSDDSMKNEATKQRDDDLRAEYDLAELKGGVRGKYYRRATAGTNIVLLEPDVARAFPNSESVNQALRLLRDIALASSGRSRRRPAKKPQ